MENKCGIMGLKEDEIELELGLSIGGSFGKVDKLKPVKNESKPNDIPVADRRESVDFDPQMQRKIQALRRHEAKKKRKEKQQMRGRSLSSRSHQNGGKDDDVTEERECKKTKVEEFSGDVNFYLNAELNNPAAAYPVLPVRVPYPYPYPHLQFVPFANGFPYSSVNSVPSWGGGAGPGIGQVAVQSVVMNGGLQTGHAHHADGYDSEQNSSKDERNRKTGSNVSSTYSSSVLSDLQSSSNQGGHSGESVTNTSTSQQEHPQINCWTPSDRKGQSDQSCTSHQMDSAQSNDKCSKGRIEKAPWMNVAESTSLNPKKAPPEAERQSPNLKSKPVLSKETGTRSSTKDANKREMGKPPKPPTPAIHRDVLGNMPYVSTTGNGADGKTINGFLYRYTKSEVSIICVCHGSSFTPAEFVRHAGGNDVSLSHPLRHITVIPSAIQQM
ncbi:hypothetical protein V6N13_020296 [Hibiscus sabdariffa]|uniref:Ninja-family protein n=1 Tax=Hibiscus sabdariffa TaxID=183260 RepID=A0ABR2EX29_9ROSI